MQRLAGWGGGGRGAPLSTARPQNSVLTAGRRRCSGFLPVKAEESSDVVSPADPGRGRPCGPRSTPAAAIGARNSP